MKVLITGGGGQLARALALCAPGHCAVVALDRQALDICDARRVSDTLLDMAPDIVINAAAYTDVEAAESSAEEARALNAMAVGHLREAAEATSARLVHVSTDFVFDGARSTPYPPDAQPRPLCEYGRTKLEGEKMVGAEALLVRTSWLYAAQGRNFVNSILSLMRERSELAVVADQVGTPTFAGDLASAIWQLAEGEARGVYHFSNSGVASWYDFALAVQEEAFEAGLLHHKIPIRPIAAQDYPSAVTRPAYSVLDCRSTYAALGRTARHWRAALRDMMAGCYRHA